MAVLTELAKYYAWDRGDLSEQEVIEQIKSGELDGFENNGEWFVRYETAVTTPSIGMKKRGVRLFAGALMPTVVAVGTIFILGYFDQTPAHEGTGFFDLTDFFYLLVIGYVLVGVQSILYSIVMEFIVNPMCSSHFTVVGISIVLGMLSGAFALWGGPIMAIIGVVPGFVTGLYLRWSYVNETSKRLQSDTVTPRQRQDAVVTNDSKWSRVWPSSPLPQIGPRHAGLPGRTRLAIGHRILIWVVILVLVVGYISFSVDVPPRVIANEDRILGTTQLAGDEVQVKASIHGKHYPSSFRNCYVIFCKYVLAHDSISVSAQPYLYRVRHVFNHGYVNKLTTDEHIAGEDKWSLEDDDLGRARAVYERLTLDWCQAVDRLAYRVYDPQASMAEPWRLLVLQGDGAEVDMVPLPVGTRSCSEALAWTSSPTE